MANSHVFQPVTNTSGKLKALLVACLTVLAGAALTVALAPAHAWADSAVEGYY